VQKSVHTPPQKRLEALLREIRQEAGLTQRQLAQRLRVPQSRVSDYERGESLPDILVLRQYLAAMDVSLAEFVQRLEQSLETSGKSKQRAEQQERPHPVSRAGAL
jgi:transcriptional regulator with XRE-family HTH domain